MAGIPFLDSGLGSGTNGPASVSRPKASLKFGAAESAGSGLGGLVDAAASLLGGGAAGDPWRDHLLSLRLRRALAPEVDVLELLVAAVPTGPAVALADSGSLSLSGSDGSDTAVFTGKVDGLFDRARGVRAVTATNGSRELAQARLNRSFEQQDAGQIIEALASELGLSSELSGDAPALPRFVVDDRASLYAHIARLAALSGHAVCIGADGRVRVKGLAASAEPVARVAFGLDVLDFSLGERAPHTAAVQVTGEGAAGDQGSDAWCWLRKDPTSNQSSAGAGAPRTSSVAALRSADSVAGFASARLARASEATTRGWLLIAGAPQIEPGDNVAVSGMPQAARDGTYRVEEIVHELDARAGFRSRLRVIRAGAGGAGGGVGGLLGKLP
jgi:hypothetical protein